MSTGVRGLDLKSPFIFVLGSNSLIELELAELERRWTDRLAEAESASAFGFDAQIPIVYLLLLLIRLRVSAFEFNFFVWVVATVYRENQTVHALQWIFLKIFISFLSIEKLCCVVFDFSQSIINQRLRFGFLRVVTMCTRCHPDDDEIKYLLLSL